MSRSFPSRIVPAVFLTILGHHRNIHKNLRGTKSVIFVQNASHALFVSSDDITTSGRTCGEVKVELCSDFRFIRLIRAHGGNLVVRCARRECAPERTFWSITQTGQVRPQPAHSRKENHARRPFPQTRRRSVRYYLVVDNCYQPPCDCRPHTPRNETDKVPS